MAEHALDPLSSTPCVHIGVGAGKGAHGIAGFLADEPGDPSLRTDGALRLQLAGGAIGGPASVDTHLLGLVDQPAEQPTATIRFIGRETAGSMPSLVPARDTSVRVAATSAAKRAGVASTLRMQSVSRSSRGLMAYA